MAAGWHKLKKTSAPGLTIFIIVDFGTKYRGPSFFTGHPIDQDGYLYTLLLLCGIINIPRLVGIVKNTHELCSL